MGFLDFILSSKNSHKKNFNLDFEVFKSLGAEKYQEIKDEEGKDMQEFEDSIMESRLKSKARNRVLAWDFGRIYVDDSFKIYGSFYTIHNDKYAKWKDYDKQKEFEDKWYKIYREETINSVKEDEYKNLKPEDLKDYRVIMFYNNSVLEAFKRKNNIV